VLDALSPETARFVYISSTGVYGQADGEWVDEFSPCHPAREGGRVCLAAEEALRRHRLADRVIILRLAGIYGPGRLPNQRALMAGEPIASPAHGFLNLIHVHDAAAVVLAAVDRGRPPQLFNVSDGHPVPRREYYQEAARLWGAPAPRFVKARADSPAALRATTDKRISNARLLAELGVRLAYPSYREGLSASDPKSRGP
jgi:nucleoside-diphosphate-sugar epimerase